MRYNYGAIVLIKWLNLIVQPGSLQVESQTGAGVFALLLKAERVDGAETKLLAAAANTGP